MKVCELLQVEGCWVWFVGGRGKRGRVKQMAQVHSTPLRARFDVPSPPWWRVFSMRHLLAYVSLLLSRLQICGWFLGGAIWPCAIYWRKLRMRHLLHPRLTCLISMVALLHSAPSDQPTMQKKFQRGKNDHRHINSFKRTLFL